MRVCVYALTHANMQILILFYLQFWLEDNVAEKKIC